MPSSIICITIRAFASGDGGSRTHAPLRTYRISSATSYDHLSTSPDAGSMPSAGTDADNCITFPGIFKP